MAKARAPAFTVKPRRSIAASIRSRVSLEIERLPDRAYDTVLRDTPASRATSPMVATMLLSTFLVNRFDKSMKLDPVLQVSCGRTMHDRDLGWQTAWKFLSNRGTAAHNRWEQRPPPIAPLTYVSSLGSSDIKVPVRNRITDRGSGD